MNHNLTGRPEICDETEVMNRIMIRERCYEVPQDVANEIKTLRQQRDALRDACKKQKEYWEACARSARKCDEAATHAGCHEAGDEPHLAKLADEAARETWAALEMCEGGRA